jgi:hypothetical protein
MPTSHCRRARNVSEAAVYFYLRFPQQDFDKTAQSNVGSLTAYAKKNIHPATFSARVQKLSKWVASLMSAARGKTHPSKSAHRARASSILRQHALRLLNLHRMQLC